MLFLDLRQFLAREGMLKTGEQNFEDREQRKLVQWIWMSFLGLDIDCCFAERMRMSKVLAENQ